MSSYIILKRERTGKTERLGFMSINCFNTARHHIPFRIIPTCVIQPLFICYKFWNLIGYTSVHKQIKYSPICVSKSDYTMEKGSFILSWIICSSANSVIFISLYPTSLLSWHGSFFVFLYSPRNYVITDAGQTLGHSSELLTKTLDIDCYMYRCLPLATCLVFVQSIYCLVSDMSLRWK